MQIKKKKIKSTSVQCIKPVYNLQRVYGTENWFTVRVYSTENRFTMQIKKKQIKVQVYSA